MAYYKSDGSLVDVVATNTEGFCFGLLKGTTGCSDMQGYLSHQFTFSNRSPWVGLHGQKQAETITSLGLIVFDSEAVRCKPYSA